jgi:Stage II sporulation protein E (SpoIIE)
MGKPYAEPRIDEYLRQRLMPVEGAIPHLPGIEMYGNSVPAETVGGDLFEYINFQQRYDLDARIQRALTLSKEFLERLPLGSPPRNPADDHVQWLKLRPDYRPELETEYRDARSSEQVRIAEDLEELYTTAGVWKMLYGEVHPYGYFRFVNFGHPPPLVFSAERAKFAEIDKGRMVQFLALGLQIPEDHPDRKRCFSMQFRQRRANLSDVAEITLMNPGDILFLYTDGVYDGSDEEERLQIESVMREHCRLPAKDICNALVEYAVRKDDHLRQIGEQDRIITRK